MPTVLVQCPGCSHSYSVDSQILGKKGRCKHCGGVFALSFSVSQDPPSTSQPSQVASPPPTSLPSQIGRFQVRERLGSGAFGTVYRAFDPVLEREVALKVPLAGALQDPKDIERFLREAKAAAQLHHPNIVPIHDAGTDGDLHYIASEFIPGQTLSAALTEGALDFDRAARVIIALADALNYAHSKGIVHRDVKPSNIMLDAQGEPLLMDFGLAHLESSQEKLTHSGAILGTPAYMSPEQASSDNVGPASDQYSLGVTLYEMLCGQPPFSGPPAVVIFNTIHTDPPSPRTHHTAIARDLETICLKALAKRREDRYPNCGELADDLRRWVAGEPTRARRLGAVERVTKWSRRNPVVAGLAATVALCLVVGTGISSYFAVRANRYSSQMVLRAGEANAHAARAEQERARANGKAIEAQANAEEARREKQRADEKAALADSRARELQASVEAERKAKEWADEQAAEARRERLSAQRSLYRTTMGLIHLAREEEGIDQILRLLDDQRPEATGGDDLRGWEWHYLHRRYDPSRIIFTHSESPDRSANDKSYDDISILFSSDGAKLGWSGRQGLTRVWDLATGATLFEDSDPNGVAPYLAFSPDGKTLALGRRHGRVLCFVDLVTQEKSEVSTQPKGSRNHRDQFGGVRFSMDGRFISYRHGHDDSLDIFDASSRRFLHTIQSSENYSFDPTSSQLITFWNSVFTMWDTRTWQPRDTLKWDFLGTPLISDDGTRIATSKMSRGRSEVTVRTLGGPVRVLEQVAGRGGVAFKLAFSTGGKRLASADRQGPLQVWSTESGKALFVGKRGREFLHPGTQLVDFIMSPDGRRLAWSYTDGLVKVCDIGEMKIMTTLKVEPRTHSGGLIFSPDGTRLASADRDGTIRVWSTRTSAEGARTPLAGSIQPSKPRDQKSLDSHALSLHRRPLLQRVDASMITSLAFSPDRNSLAIGSWSKYYYYSITERFLTGKDPAPACVEVWDARSGQLTHVPKRVAREKDLDGLGDGVWLVSWSGDGKYLFSASSNHPLQSSELRLERLDPFGGNQNKYLNINSDIIDNDSTSKNIYYYQCALFNMFSRIMCIGKNGFGVYRIVDGVQLDQERTGADRFPELTRLTISVDGTRIAGLEEGKLWIGTASESAPLSYVTIEDPSLTSDQRTGKPRGSLSFSPDGRTLAFGNAAGQVKILDSASGEVLVVFPAHPTSVESVVWIPDGSRLATGGLDGEIRIWEASTGLRLLTLKGHSSGIVCLAFSPDGSLLASAALDGSVRIWDGTPSP